MVVVCTPPSAPTSSHACLSQSNQTLRCFRVQTTRLGTEHNGKPMRKGLGVLVSGMVGHSRSRTCLNLGPGST